MDVITAEPTVRVERPVMRQRWADVTYLHWRYDPDVVQALLPAGVRVDTFDGHAWVGLVPFVMRDLHPPFLPPLPWLSSFVEVNVRTYVVDPTGRRAVWFLSLDVPRAGAVAVARLAYGLPYMWARCRFVEEPGAVRFETARRWPHRRGAATVEVRVGEALPRAMPALEQFLTARWGLVSGRDRRLRYAPVDHPAWPLHTGEVISLHQTLVQAAGLPAPVGAPLVHYSPGVDVAVGRPERLEPCDPGG